MISGSLRDKKVLCIEIGTQKTRVCEVDYRKKNPHVYDCFTIDTPAGSIEDGYIKDSSELAKELKLKLEEKKIKNNKVVFTLTSTKIANREVLLPMVKDDKIQEIINISASDYFPVDISEYTISHSVLEKINNKENKNLRLLVFAAPNYLIKNYHAFAELMNFDVIAMDYIGNSTYQLLKKQVEDGVNLVVQINEETTLINIINNEMLVLQRVLPYGSNAVLEAVVTSSSFNVDTDKAAYELLCDEELINSHIDTEMDEAAVAVESINDEIYKRMLLNIKGKEEVTNSLQYLVSNVIRVVDYYNSKFPENSIKKLYLMGQGAKFRGIGHLMGNEVGIEVKKIEKLFTVVFSNQMNITGTNEVEYISCIGSAIKPVNFLLKGYLDNQKRKSSIMTMAVIFGLSIFTSVLIGGLAILQFNGASNEKLKLEEEIGNLTYIETIFNETETIINKHEKVSTMYNVTRNYNEQLNTIIKEMEDRMPSAVLVKSMAATTSGIVLNMTATSKLEVAKLILQLKTIESIDSIQIDSVSESEDDMGVKTVSFSVAFNYGTFNYEKENIVDEE